MRPSKIGRPFVVAAALLVAASAASAGCYDVFGCSDQARFKFEDLANGPNCDFLYTMRNQIYAERQYCFKTARAIATFGNENCRYADASRLPLNGVERENAAMILSVERAKGCAE
jgi:hypothetical protein